jgi:hypothetical protein
MPAGLAAFSLRSVLLGLYAAITPAQKKAIASAATTTVKNYQSGDNMREEKRQRLFGKEGKIRDAFTPAARARRQERRKGRRGNIWDALTRASAGQISGNATAESANVRMPGQNLPDTSKPQGRRSSALPAASTPSYDVGAWYTNPVFWVLGGGAYLYLTRKK